MLKLIERVDDCISELQALRLDISLLISEKIESKPVPEKIESKPVPLEPESVYEEAKLLFQDAKAKGALQSDLVNIARTAGIKGKLVDASDDALRRFMEVVRARYFRAVNESEPKLDLLEALDKRLARLSKQELIKIAADALRDAPDKVAMMEIASELGITSIPKASSQQLINLLHRLTSDAKKYD